VAACLPFVNAVWQVYILIFVLQSASAAFTPTFQATIPDVLPDEKDYTHALSLSRLAYDMESLTSPMIAAALLGMVSYHWLFSGTAVGFLASALLVLATVLPSHPGAGRQGGIYDKTTRGTRIILKTPRLRGLLALTLSAAAASSMVIVNTVVIVRGLGLAQSDVALTLAAYGGGSILAALVLPGLLDQLNDRSVMLSAAAVMTAVLAAMAWVTPNGFSEAGLTQAGLMQAGAANGSYWRVLLVAWAVMGMAYSMSMTPSGRLLRRSANAEDRPALFAAQFALSHVCWLSCYPLAGQLGARVGMGATFAAMAVISAAGLALGMAIWPRRDPDRLDHHHDDLPDDHPHHDEHRGQGHTFVIDDLHPRWPA
jgi:predicted MFS family arabinose efflux permease